MRVRRPNASIETMFNDRSEFIVNQFHGTSQTFVALCF